MFPKAVREGLVVREVRGECVVYHTRDRRICRLNRAGLFVWRQCDGSTSPAEIAGRLAAETALPSDEGLVRSTLEDLRRNGLIEHSAPAEKVETRRELVIRLARTAAAAAIMPLVVGIASPLRAAVTVASPEGGPCGSLADIQPHGELNYPNHPSLGTRLAGGVVFVCEPGLICQNNKCVKPAPLCAGLGESCEVLPCCPGGTCDGICYPDD